MNKIVSIACVFGGLLNSIVAQTQLQYQLNQQGSGSCSGSTVTLSVSTSVNITTAAVSEISSSFAISGGNISNDGGNPITQRGVCWSTSPNPTTTDNITNNGNGLGSFTSSLSELAANTTYYIRAYAINSAGIFYGNEVSFTSISLEGTINSCGLENVFNGELNYSSLVDIDGNVYKTIVIGNQEWMAENLKAARYNNGDSVTFISDPDLWINTSEGAWSNLDGDTFYNCNCGNVYNWYAVSDERNLCPTGWHVPTDQDWDNLLGFIDLEFSPIAADAFGSSSFSFPTQSDTAGKLLKSNIFGWFEPPGSYNQAGFSALSCGLKSAFDGIHYGYGTSTAIFWSASPSYNSNYALPNGPKGVTRTLYDFNNSVYKNSLVNGNGFPLRCVKDEIVVQAGTINELKCNQYVIRSNLNSGTQISSMPINIPYSGGNGGIIEGVSIQALNSAELNLTSYSSLLGGPFGIIEMQLSGNIPDVDTVRFEIEVGGRNCQLKLPTNNTALKVNQDCHTCGAKGVHNPEKLYGVASDIDGQLYLTIEIGNHTWFAENLKTLRYSNGDFISEVNESPGLVAVNEGAWCYYDYNPQYNCPYGKLYNWQAVSDPRGVCPDGWHVSTLTDWQELIATLDSTTIDTLNLPTYILSETVNSKLRSTSKQFSTDPNLNATNSFGFSALPGGVTSYFDKDYFNLLGGYCFWWLMPNPEYPIQYPSINFTTENNTVYINGNYDFGRGLSIRCVKD
jgi:uncharacterized protein (TIGR02145 family)